MTPEEVRRQLSRYPRLPYVVRPSPLEPLARLRELLPGPSAPAVWIKRDDELGPGMGGNKGRKLAYLMGEAQQLGRRKVITYGGLQSNHARMTAAAAAQLGLEAHLFFFERRPVALTGNLLLNALLGAKMHFLPVGGGGKATRTIEATNRLVRLAALPFAGRSAYFIPVGGHTLTGGLGYVEAACEIAEQVQARQLDPAQITVITAAGTGGTLAGLLAGFALLESPIRVLGIDIGKLWKGFPASICTLANELLAALGSGKRFMPQEVALIEEIYAGEAYAKPHPPAAAAIRLAARSEAILLDPVYTGKAFAGMLDLIGNGRYSASDTLIFLHTGGLPGLWVKRLQEVT